MLLCCLRNWIDVVLRAWGAMRIEQGLIPNRVITWTGCFAIRVLAGKNMFNRKDRRDHKDPFRGKSIRMIA